MYIEQYLRVKSLSQYDCGLILLCCKKKKNLHTTFNIFPEIFVILFQTQGFVAHHLILCCFAFCWGLYLKTCMDVKGLNPSAIVHR